MKSPDGPSCLRLSLFAEEPGKHARSVQHSIPIWCRNPQAVRYVQQEIHALMKRLDGVCLQELPPETVRPDAPETKFEEARFTTR